MQARHDEDAQSAARLLRGETMTPAQLSALTDFSEIVEEVRRWRTEPFRFPPSPYAVESMFTALADARIEAARLREALTEALTIDLNYRWQCDIEQLIGGGK
jgi:hypothetical protein